MKLDEFFRYNVGDVLRHVVCAQVPYDRYGREDSRFIVTSRFLEECAGGIQPQYICHMVMRSGAVHGQAVRLHQHELVLSRPFGVDDNEETDADRIRRQTGAAGGTDG